ncbi:MAG: YecR family lipoprotein [Ferruginibacter sp.]
MRKSDRQYYLLAIILILFSSCKVHKYLSVLDGSKADGTITLYFEYGSMERPVVHWDEAKKEALSKCKNWGYNNAEFFGSGVKQCTAYNINGQCIRWRVIYKCQCIN